MYNLIFLGLPTAHSVATVYQVFLKETDKGRFINFLESNIARLWFTLRLFGIGGIPNCLVM